MKKNIIKFLAFGSLLLTTSCVDLDQEPQSFLTEEEYINYPQTIETVNRGVTGLYNDLWSGNYDFCCRMLRYHTAAGDMVPQLAKPNNEWSLLSAHSDGRSYDGKLKQQPWLLIYTE